MLTAMSEDEIRGSETDALEEERRLIEALRSGDEAAFCTLVDRYHLSLLRVAQIYVDSRAVAEEVVQETWLGVLQGIGRFEGRSSLKTWLFRILTNRAKSRGERERRLVPFSELIDPELDLEEPAVDPARFHTAGPYPGHWAAAPQSWGATPEAQLLSAEVLAEVRRAIDALRRPGLAARGGLPGARRQRRQPARAAAPRPQPGALGARAVLRPGARWWTMTADELTCRELVELVTDYLEGALSPADHALFEAHLADCRGCRNYLEQIRRTISLTGRLTEASIPEAPKQALLAAFRSWKQARSM
jgi:RNA polymerase sigma-70 factor (ECF subfamily)